MVERLERGKVYIDNYGKKCLIVFIYKGVVLCENLDNGFIYVNVEGNLEHFLKEVEE